LRFPDLEVPHSVSDALGVLEAGHHQLRADLAVQTETDLDSLVLTNWHERWPAWRIFWTMLNHDALHTGTIGQLRDDYLWRQPARSPVAQCG
jgi:hypothetical protein